MTESAKQKILEAAVVADWMQVVLNQGPPCFHLEEYGSFCLRSERWDGHGIEDFHDFVSLHDLLRILIIPENDTPTSPASSPEATQQKWRVGGKVPLNVYKVDRPIFQAHSIEDAREVVDGMNAATQQAATSCQWKTTGTVEPAWNTPAGQAAEQASAGQAAPNESEELRRQLLCDVCVGTGNLASGKPCICGGSGFISDAFRNLRRDMIDQQQRLDEVERLRQRADESRMWHYEKAEEARSRLAETQGIARELAEYVESFVKHSAPLAAMAGYEVDLCQATHWLNETSKEANAALARSKAAGIASSPTEPPQAALPPSK